MTNEYDEVLEKKYERLDIIEVIKSVEEITEKGKI